MGEAMSRRIRGVFNAANFWAIVLFNVLALNNLEFAKLVGRRLIFKGRDKKGRQRRVRPPDVPPLTVLFVVVFLPL